MSQKGLRLAPGLVIPVDVGTSTIAIFGKRGSGKTNTAVVLAEELARAKQPFAVLDPVDVWWGLKASRDGAQAGLPVYVFGGRHQDLPLEPGAGALIADVLVDQRISAVLSCKHMTGGERARFVLDFAKRLLSRNTEAFHLFLEEAHELAPQDLKAVERAPELAGVVSRLWKLGRSSGIGGSAITQRPASLSKNVTTQAEILIVHRTIGPQDVKAIQEWIKYHGESQEVLAELATLKTGEAFVWAPDFPEDKPIGLRRVKIRERRTFDSSRTPKAGETKTEPKELAQVDLEALRERMAETIERADAEDPAKLRKRIRELEKTLAQVDLNAPDRSELEGLEALLEQVRVDGNVFASHFQRKIAGVLERFDEATEACSRALQQLGQEAREEISKLVATTEGKKRKPKKRTPDDVQVNRPLSRAIARAAADPRTLIAPEVFSDQLDGPMQRILDAMAWLEAARAPQPWARVVVAYVSRYSPKSSGFKDPLSRLRQRGFVEYGPGSTVEFTDQGRCAAATVDQVPTAEDLQARVLELIDGPMGRILTPLLEAYPAPLERGELAGAAGYSQTSSGFKDPLSRLRSLGLVDYPTKGSAVALAWLFLEKS